MKKINVIFASVTVIPFCVRAVSNEVWQSTSSESKTSTNEAEQFWSRYLQQDTSLTAAPVSPPTKASVVPETLAPMSPPTPSPITAAPISPPTNAPIIPPSPSPVVPETPSPSPFPTQMPVSVPSFPPSQIPQVDCFIDVSVECQTVDGVQCDQILPPQLSCDNDVPFQFLTFSFNGQTCPTSVNSQGDEAFCEDFELIPNEPVTVRCRTPEGSSLMIEPITVPPGGIFTISNSNGNNLPSAIDCAIFNANGFLLQQNVISTAGDVPLNLGNSFGALTLESCSAEKSCIENIVYRADIFNIGTVDLNINSAAITFNNVTGSVLEQIQDKNPLLPGQSTTLEPNLEINICGGTTFFFEIKVDGSPPNGELCQDTEQYVFSQPLPVPQPTSMPIPLPTSPPVAPPENCSIEVSLDCSTGNRLPCNEITPPVSTTCSDGTSIEVVTMTYQNFTCDPVSNNQGSAAFCNDTAPLNFQEPKKIECATQDGTRMTVEPPVVYPGQSFTITNPSGIALPSKVACRLVDPVTNTQVQFNGIDFSGTVNLQLGDRFGALELNTCDDISCREVLFWQVDIINTGSVPATVAVVEVTLNNETASFLEQIPDDRLEPGSFISFEPTVEGNICTGMQYSASVNVEGNPPNGETCQSEDAYSFQVPPLIPQTPPTSSPMSPPVAIPSHQPTLLPEVTETPAPLPFPTAFPRAPPSNPPVPEQCVVEANLGCKSASSGQSCNEITPPTSSICSDGTAIEVVTMSYKNFTCDPLANDQGDAAFCNDTAPLDFGVAKIIECSDRDGTRMVVEPRVVEPLQSFTITNPSGGALPNKVGCRLINANTNTQVQFNGMDFSGSVSLQLGDRFGALELDACNDLSCRDVICWLVNITNTGAVTMDINTVDISLNGVMVSFLDQVPVNTLGPGEATSVEPKVEVDICSGSLFRASINVEGAPTPDGRACQASDDYSFEVPTLPQRKLSIRRHLSAVTTDSWNALTLPNSLPSKKECAIHLQHSCRVTSLDVDAERMCTNAAPNLEPCTSRPTAITMLFSGGDCSQSDNAQPDKFFCTDLGPISTELGTPYYIVVTDAKGKGITYFSGIVNVGDFYKLGDGTDRLEADQTILIYTPDQATMLQDVQYHSSCSQNLELKNRFGANQIVEFLNEEQGLVSCFETFSFTLNIEVPISVTGEAITLSKLTVDTNFAGQFDLTDQVANVTVQPGGYVVATLEGEVDFCISQTYTFDVDVEGSNTNRELCLGQTAISFKAGGYPLIHEMRPFTKEETTIDRSSSGQVESAHVRL